MEAQHGHWIIVSEMEAYGVNGSEQKKRNLIWRLRLRKGTGWAIGPEKGAGFSRGRGAVYVNQHQELIWAVCSGLTFGRGSGGAPTGCWILVLEMEADAGNGSEPQRGLVCGLGLRLWL